MTSTTSNNNIIQQEESHKMQEEAAEAPYKSCNMPPMPQQLMQQSSNSVFTPKFNRKSGGARNTTETSKQRLLQAESTLVKQGSFMMDQHQKSLALLRHASSQCSGGGVNGDALERMETPSPATMKRTLSILVGGLGPQLQQSFMKNIATPSQPPQHPQPQQIDFTSLINGVTQPQPHQPKSPNMLFKQSSFVLAQQSKPTTVQQKSVGDFNIPQPRFQTRNSLISNEPFTPTGFLRSTNTNNAAVNSYHIATANNANNKTSSSGIIAESPSDLKQLRGRLGRRFHQQQRPQMQQQASHHHNQNNQMIDFMEERQQAAEEQREQVLRQIFGVAGTPVQQPALNHRESLHLKKMLHSLMSLSSPVPEFGTNAAEAKRLNYKQARVQPANIAPSMCTIASMDLILDNHATAQQAAEQPLKELVKPNTSNKSQVDQNKNDSHNAANAVRTSKSGPGRKPIQVVEQESELTKVSYSMVNGQKCAVFQNGLGIIDDFMASDNLNECVDALLEKKSKAAFHQHAAALEMAKKLKDASEQLSTNENSPNVAKSQGKYQFNGIPRVVIRHRIKGAKKAQKRLRKNGEQNKVLMGEFKKNPIWQKAKIVELQQRLGLKQSQIYKWNWDMQRKIGETQGKREGGSVSAPDLSCDLSAAGDFADIDRSENEDSDMSQSDSQNDDEEQTPRSSNLQII